VLFKLPIQLEPYGKLMWIDDILGLDEFTNGAKSVPIKSNRRKFNTSVLRRDEVIGNKD
jgi:hypothetical protein